MIKIKNKIQKNYDLLPLDLEAQEYIGSRNKPSDLPRVWVHKDWLSNNDAPDARHLQLRGLVRCVMGPDAPMPHFMLYNDEAQTTAGGRLELASVSPRKNRIYLNLAGYSHFAVGSQSLIMRGAHELKHIRQWHDRTSNEKLKEVGRAAIPVIGAVAAGVVAYRLRGLEPGIIIPASLTGLLGTSMAVNYFVDNGQSERDALDFQYDDPLKLYMRYGRALELPEKADDLLFAA